MFLTGLAAFLAVVGVYSLVCDLVLRDRDRVSKRVDEEFRKRERDRAQKSALLKNKNFSSVAAEVAAAEVAARPSLRERFETMVEQSGLDLTPYRLLVIMAGTGLILGSIGGFVRQSPVIGALATVVGTSAPFLYVSLKRKARLEKLLSQLPDAFDLMARVIRAGQTMSQALLAVADEFETPVATEFAFCFEQQNLGLPPEISLRELARRTGLVEIRIFVLSLLVQQQTGGNLAELLDKLAGVIRERFRIRGKIKALTAEGRMQAAVLLALPPLMFLVIMLMNPNYGRVLYQYPGLLIGMVVSELFGALWIRKIVNFDF
jgi:tight adherence protein B